MFSEIIKKNFIDKTTSFVKNNIKIIIILLLIIFIFISIFLFYLNLEKKNKIKIAEDYTQASILIKQKKINESRLILEDIIKEDHQFYSPMALYLLIDNNIVSEKIKVINLFDKILSNNSIDQENLNLIKIKKAIFLINSDNEKLIIKTLNPIINSNSIWKDTAINLISDYFLSKNQKIKADEYLQMLIDKKK